MDMQKKIDYINKKCEAFPDCEGCPVLHSTLYNEICQTISFEDLDDQRVDRLVELLKANDNARIISLSDDDCSHTGIGTSCIICGGFIPIDRPVDDRRICHSCIKKLRILMGIEQDDVAVDYDKLQQERS